MVHLIGLLISAWAYRRSRKAGYLLVAAYFFLAVCSLTVVPAINREIVRRWRSQSELSPEAREQYRRESMALAQKYYPSGSPPATIDIDFPLGPITLVAGIWVLAKREASTSAK
jgi:hypothetical protein